MAWLHAWAGLLVGWVLYFVFLTGTFGYVQSEVSHWMRPEQRAAAGKEAAAHLLGLAEARLRETAPNSELWQIAFPDIRGNADFSIRWRDWPSGGIGRAPVEREILDPRSGHPAPSRARATGGG